VTDKALIWPVEMVATVLQLGPVELEDGAEDFRTTRRMGRKQALGEAVQGCRALVQQVVVVEVAEWFLFTINLPGKEQASP
jgi:hypothetical protein